MTLPLQNAFVSKSLASIKSHLALTKNHDNYVIFNYDAVNIDVIKKISKGHVHEGDYRYIALPKILFSNKEVTKSIFKLDVSPCWEGSKLRVYVDRFGKEIPYCS